MPQTVVVVGCAGQLGHELVREFAARQWTVIGLDRQSLDITDAAHVERALSDSKPDLVINSAAYNQVDRAESEPEAAFQTNSLAVRNLAVAARALSAKLVHFSTDYVFDGTVGRSYTEYDSPHPISAYGVSKLAGELYAQAYLDNPLVIRTSGVFGPAGRTTARGNFVELMLRLAREGKPIRVVNDHVASPTFAPELARITADLIDADAGGIFHAGGGTPISWYEYAALIFQTAGLSPDLHPTNDEEFKTAARRPKFSALENRRCAEAGIAPILPLRECIQRYFRAVA